MLVKVAVLVLLLALFVYGLHVRSRALKVLCFLPAVWFIVELISGAL